MYSHFVNRCAGPNYALSRKHVHSVGPALAPIVPRLAGALGEVVIVLRRRPQRAPMPDDAAAERSAYVVPLASDPQDDLPKYMQIRRELEERIRSGVWPPGTRVPSEHELTEQFQCSRMTVNKALSALAHAGLIVRKRRLGTVVARQVSQQAVMEINDIKAEISERGLVHRQEVVSRRTGMAKADDLLRLGLAERVRVLDVHICHFGGDLPMVMERRLINLAAVPDAETADFADIPPGTWLLDKVPWTQAEHRIRAIGADAETAFLLRLAEGAPCLLIERRTWRGGEPITWAEIIHAGDQFELFGRFAPHPR